MKNLLRKFSSFVMLLVMTGLFFSSPTLLHAQVCNGVCINITPASTGGSGGSEIIIPSNLGVFIEENAVCVESRQVNVRLEYSNASSVAVSNDELFTEDEFFLLNGIPDQNGSRRGADGEEIRVMEIDWELSAGEGVKEVFVVFRSRTQNISRIYSDMVTLDTSNSCEGVGDGSGGDSGQILNVSPGEYIKGVSFPGVYLVTEDFERRPFLNETIYFTYQQDFDVVRVVSDSTLPSLPLGLSMLPKEGTVLVKVPSAPEVYFIVENSDDPTTPVLRWVLNEVVAETVFGENWKRYLVDIPETHFSRFTIGESISNGDGIDTAQLIPTVLLTGQKFTADSDVDGLTDYLEWQFGTDLFDPDSDDDRLEDGLEYFYQTNPHSIDTDGDGSLDGDEVRDGFNPNGEGTLDSDGDGLDDPLEFVYGTDRYNVDSDGDGFDDKTEIDHGFDPLGPGLLDQSISGFSFTRYVLSAFDLAAYKLRSLLPF